MKKVTQILTLACFTCFGFGCSVENTPQAQHQTAPQADAASVVSPDTSAALPAPDSSVAGPDASVVSPKDTGTPQVCKPADTTDCTVACPPNQGLVGTQPCRADGLGYDNVCFCAKPTVDAGIQVIVTLDAGNGSGGSSGNGGSSSSGTGGNGAGGSSGGSGGSNGNDAAIDAPAVIPPDTAPVNTDTAANGPEVLTPDTAPVAADAAPAQSDTLVIAPDTAPLLTDANPVILVDSGATCVEKTILPDQPPCYDDATERWGFVVCKNGRPECVFPTPRKSSDCSYYREGEIDYYSVCEVRDGCDNGSYVCKNNEWVCKMTSDYWYWVPAACLPPPDAGADTSSASDGTGGVGGSSGTGGTGGAGDAGTGGSAGTGGAGGNSGSGGTAGTGDAGTGIDAIMPGPNEKPIVDCVLVAGDTSKVNITVSGYFDHALNDTKSSLDNSGKVRVCLVGDFVGWQSRTDATCKDWVPDPKTYTFLNVPIRYPVSDSRINLVKDNGNLTQTWVDDQLINATGRCAVVTNYNLVIQ